MRPVGPGGLIVPGPVLLLDASTAAAVVAALDLEAQRLDVYGRHPAADNALAALVALARTAEQKRSVSQETGSVGVPSPCAADRSGARSTAMVTPHADQLDASDAASQLGVGPRAIRYLAERGTLPGRKVGGGWRFDKADIDNLAERRARRRSA